MNLQPLLEALTEDRDFSLEGLDDADWAQLARAIRHGAFDQTALIRLAGSASGNEAAVPVLAELTADLGVSLAIARALLSEDSVDQLTALLEESGLRMAWEADGPAERLVVPLARLLGTPKAWIWLARGLFHSSVVGVVPEMVRDSDVAVRVAAIEALGDTPGDEAIEALFAVLHDASDQVRAAAKVSLERRCTDPALRRRLEDELTQVNQIVERGSQVGSMLQHVPGLSGLMAAFRRGQRARALGGLGANPRRQGVLDGLRRRFRLYRGREDSTGYVVLAVAMAWADGTIRDYEARTLDNLVEEYLAESERAPVRELIRTRPSPERLAAYVARLNDPRSVAGALRKDFDLDTDEAQAWLRRVATAAQLPEDALLP